MRLNEIATEVGIGYLRHTPEGRKAVKVINSILPDDSKLDPEHVTGVDLARLISSVDDNTYVLLTKLDIPVDDVLVAFPRKTIFVLGMGLLTISLALVGWYTREALRSGYLPASPTVVALSKWWNG